jgi:hypothetical protein
VYPSIVEYPSVVVMPVTLTLTYKS